MIFNRKPHAQAKTPAPARPAPRALTPKRPVLPTGARIILKNKTSGAYVCGMSDDQTTTDPALANTYSPEFLNTSCWDWHLLNDAIPEAKLKPVKNKKGAK